MATARQFIEVLLTRKGIEYVFGAEADGNDPAPDQIDCSEFIEWGSKRVGLSPPAPDGSWNQYEWIRKHGMLIPVEQGIKTPGALLFMGDGTGVGRDSIHHVAPSLGNGYTIEARGRAYGVGVFSAYRHFDFAGLMPGIEYRNASAPPKAAVRQVLKLGDKGRDVLFAQAMFNIIIPNIAPKGYTNGELLALDGVWGNSTASVNLSFERFWNQKGPGRTKPLQEDTTWTMNGTGPAVAALVRLIMAQK